MLKQILLEMGFNPTKYQVSELHFSSTFAWQISIREAKQENLAKVRKQKPRFKKHAFMKWMFEHVSKLKLLTKEQKEDLVHSKNIYEAEQKNKSFDRSRLNMSVDSPARRPVSDVTTKCLDLLSELRQERQAKIGVARPILNQIILSEQFNKDPHISGRRGPTMIVQEMESENATINERVNNIADGIFHSTMSKNHEDRPFLSQINKRINKKISGCFNDLSSQGKNDKAMLLEALKAQREEKLKNDFKEAEEAQQTAKDRITCARQQAEHKHLEEVVTIMREQDSALRAQRIYKMLYKDEQDGQKQLRKATKKLLTPEMERKVNALMRK